MDKKAKNSTIVKSDDLLVEQEAQRVSAAFAGSDIEFYGTVDEKTISQYSSKLISPKEVIKSTDALNEYMIDPSTDYSKFIESPFRKSLAIRVSLTMESSTVSTSSKISPFERDIIEAMISLYFFNRRKLKGKYDGDFVVTAASIYRIIYGLDKLDKRLDKDGIVRYSLNIPANALKNIDDAIKRLMSVQIEIELNDSDDQGYNRTISGAVLPIERVHVKKKNGGACDAYRLVTQPILLTYGLYSSTLAAVSIRQNRLPGSLSRTTYNIATRSVLMSACLSASLVGLDHVSINYQSIYDQRNAKDNRQKIRARNAVKEILEYWKSDENNLIDDYSEYYEDETKKAPEGVHIVFLPNQINLLSDGKAGEAEPNQ